MASRASARTAAARSQASSPPRQSTQSPVARRMRTRSASVELGSDNATPATKKGKRVTRQASVESVDNNASSASSNQGGRRKKGTRGAVTYPELSIVAEDEEEEQPEDEEEYDEEEAEGSGHPPRSPGGMSQMSGTTAITSASAQTSHTNAELADLDGTMVIETLSDLWVSSCQILALPPSNASMELIEAFVRELKVPGSAQAKRLMHREQKFTVDRGQFGSDIYIRPNFIQQKVFSSEDIEPGMLRPDAIFFVANLATFSKELWVKQKEGLSTYQFLLNLDTWFPESFVAQFGDNILFGNSTLPEQCFEFALEVRTHYTIGALRYHHSGESQYDPDQVLMEAWFDPLAQNSAEVSPFEHALENGAVKKLMRAGPGNTEHQEELIRKRVLEIRSAFRDSEDAAQAGDLVDFDQLDGQFPFPRFQANGIRYMRLRLHELTESIRLQGGTDNIVKMLVDMVKNNNSQAELNFEPHPSTIEPRQLLPSVNIVPGTSGHSLMTKSTVRRLETMKQTPSGPSSAQSQLKVPISKTAASSSSHRTAQPDRPGQSRTRSTGPSEVNEEPRQVFDDFTPIDDDENELFVPERTVRSSAAYLSTWDAHARDKNKENRPLTAQENGKTVKRFIDQQANAQKVRWSSPESQESEEIVAGPSKRKHARVEPDEDDDSQDEGFQANQRNPNLNLRVPAPKARRVSPVPARRPSPKRARAQEDNQATAATLRRRQREENELQASARREASDEESEREDDFDEEADLDEEPPRPSATQVTILARREVALVKRRTAVPQKRREWSIADTELLQDRIEEMGCSWSAIHKAGGFERDPDQIALKDKARNMKVNFLKARVPLPFNFENIPLGQKEIRSVRAVVVDYDGDP